LVFIVSNIFFGGIKCIGAIPKSLGCSGRREKIEKILPYILMYSREFNKDNGNLPTFPTYKLVFIIL